MNEDFVGYEIAKKLKEKGFEWCRVTTYNPNTKVRNNHLEPTISQVLKWLRNQNIYVEVVVDDDSEEPLTYNIHVDNENVFHHHGKYFSLKDWTKCELAGIEYVIDNLI